MFFNMTEWSQKKLRVAYILSLLSYFLVTLVGPFVIIATRYALFENKGVKTLTGFGIIVVLAFAVVGLKILRGKIKNFPEITIAQRRIKFSIELVYSLAFPIVVIAVLVALKANFDLAFSTARDSLIFFIVGILIDNLFVKYIEAERQIRFKSQEDVEKAKRSHLFK